MGGRWILTVSRDAIPEMLDPGRLSHPFVLSRDRVASQKRIEGSYRSTGPARYAGVRRTTHRHQT